MKRKAKIYYTSLDDFWRKEEKLAWLRDNPISSIEFERIESDAKHNWINQTDNDFETLLPLIDREVKFGKAEEAVFKLFSLGSVTNRDEWVYDFDKNSLEEKLKYFIKAYERKRKSLFSLKEQKRKELISNDKDFNEFIGSDIKFSRELIERDLLKNKEIQFNNSKVIRNAFRPFVKKFNYFDSEHRITHEPYQMPHIFGKFGQQENKIIAFNVNDKDFKVLATNCICDLHFIGDSQTLPFYTFDSKNQKHENITDWALTQFQTNYKDIKSITKQDIFYYTYGVLHSPQYRRKYEQNLKREFPRLPFYEDFAQWRDWGRELTDLHINYEKQKPFALGRTDLDTTAKKKIKQESLFGSKAETEDETFIVKPKTKLRADKVNNTIEIDSHTTLAGIPALAWEYKLGNRSALEWILDQYKEKKPQDTTIAERFNTYKFEDYKEQVIDLLKRVTNVSVKTIEIVHQMPNAD